MQVTILSMFFVSYFADDEWRQMRAHLGARWISAPVIFYLSINARDKIKGNMQNLV
jgi:hypothetical protein